MLRHPPSGGAATGRGDPGHGCRSLGLLRGHLNGDAAPYEALGATGYLPFSGIGMARSTGTAVTLFWGEPSTSLSE